MKKTAIIIVILAITSSLIYFLTSKPACKTLVSIANFGPHNSLNETIEGIKKQLESRGYTENVNIEYKISNVNFDTSLIPQMITSLVSNKPDVLVVLTTPVAQFAKSKVKDIPIVYADITDPFEAGLISNDFNHETSNITGVSEKVNLKLMLEFAKKLIPDLHKIGLLYSTSEANDFSLLKSLEREAKALNIELVAVAVDSSRDIPTRMQAFKNSSVDLIYVGTSGAIQPALPVIISEAEKLNIPIMNADSEAVEQKQVLASFGISYMQVGMKTGNLVADILDKGQIHAPQEPGIEDHKAVVCKDKIIKHKLELPKDYLIVE